MMPELPEVETIRRGLVRVLIGKKIAQLKIKDPKQFFGKRKLLVGSRITSIRRRGKILILELNRGTQFLAIHLKMSGQLIYAPRRQRGQLVIGGHPEDAYLKTIPNRYTRIIVTLTDGSHLYFNDLRRFGWFRLVDKRGLEQLTQRLGPEALAITPKTLATLIATGKGPRIKQLLLNQENLSGLGNIYVDESLFCAKINPFRRTDSLGAAEIRRLARCIPAILRLSLKHGGTSIQHYRNSAGRVGTFGQAAKVYGRRDRPCVRCRTPLVKKKIAGRGTHFCPICQE